MDFFSATAGCSSTCHAEHKVNNFLAALQAKDYPKAYGLFYNDPEWQQHPDKYKDYPLQRFTEDFTTESDWKGPVNSFHVDFSKRDATGTVVASTINGTTQPHPEVSARRWHHLVLPLRADPRLLTTLGRRNRVPPNRL